MAKRIQTGLLASTKDQPREQEARRAHLACLDSSISRAVIGPKSTLSRTIP